MRQTFHPFVGLPPERPTPGSSSHWESFFFPLKLGRLQAQAGCRSPGFWCQKGKLVGAAVGQLQIPSSAGLGARGTALHQTVSLKVPRVHRNNSGCPWHLGGSECPKHSAAARRHLAPQAF